MNYVNKYKALRDMYGVEETSGLADTYLDNVHFFWIAHPVDRAPLICNPGIVLIGQGIKIGYLNGREFRYDEDNYLISSVPTAYECATIATKENPLFGIFIDIDINKLNQLIAKIEKYRPLDAFKATDVFSGVEPIQMKESMHVAAEKLLTCLQSPLESEMLGQAIVDEIIYRALLSEHGKALVALTQHETRFAHIAEALDYIHTNYMDKITVEDLAHRTNMSVSSFHRAFKKVTGESPLQYLKKIRLNNAKFLIVRENTPVNIAADQVGYESVSQFSREFKRFFNMPPSAIKEVYPI